MEEGWTPLNAREPGHDRDGTHIAINPDSISGLDFLGSLHTCIDDSVAGYRGWLGWRELAWWF
jgi:hypothetical protein